MESNVVATNEDRPVEIKRKMKFTGSVEKVSLAGAVINIGSEQPAVLHISQITAENEDESLKRVEDILEVGQAVDVWVRKVKDDHIELTMIKPLDLEWREIKKGMAVKGKVVRLEKFGAFIEIGAERPGLIHISEMAHGYVRSPSDMLKEGDEIEAEVLEVSRRKKQIKLSMKALEPEPVVEDAPVLPFPKKKDKPVKRKKVSKKQRTKFEQNGDFSFALGNSSEDETETALGIALREAMEKAQSRKAQQDAHAKKEKAVSKEQQELLARTLEQKHEDS
jgi:small subunit ribosomal protein S1